MRNMVYKWMEEVHIVKGFNRSCLYDLPRWNHFLTDVGIDELKLKIDGMQCSLLNTLDENEIEWVNYLSEKEIIIPIPQEIFNNFEPIDVSFSSPSIVSNAIIENGKFLNVVLATLTDLMCYNIHIKVNDELEMEEIISTYFKTTNFQSVCFEIGQIKTDNDALFKIIEGNMFLSDILIHNWNSEAKIMNQDFTKVMKFQHKDMDVFKPNFSIDIPVYMESLDHNVFYNGKLFFFKNGDVSFTSIRENAFGNVSSTSIVEFQEIIKSASSSLWKSTKEKTAVCNQCEFRRMCIDNRLPLQTNNASSQTWYHTTECSYNPFISKWKGEPQYKSLSDCGISIMESGVHIDHERLKKINNGIWDDSDME